MLEQMPSRSCCPVIMVLLLSGSPLGAQDTDVPRTRTLSGLAAPPFPYARPEEVGLSSEKLDWIGDEIVSWIANRELVGAELLIIKDERAVFHEAYGWSDREAREPVARNSIWSIKSMSKPFTAAAVLMLADEGKLSLDDQVRRYIPSFGGDERTTIRHLLSHTSGFEGNYGQGGREDNYASLEQWVADWAAEGPTQPFGEFSYSDFNYAALGSIVGAVSGLPIATFTEERIIRPLGLDDTSTYFSEDPAWRARLNPWYRWNERARQYDLRWRADREPWPFYAAAWGLFSTAMDYAEFMSLWLGKGEWRGTRLLAEGTVRESLRPHARYDESSGYGYGWNIDEVQSAELPPFTHGGGDGTQAGAYPDDNAIVILLTHSRWGPWVDGFWNRIDMSGVFDRLVGYGVNGYMEWAGERNVMDVELPPEVRAEYEGTYLVADSDDPPSVLTVWVEDGHLQVRAGPRGSRSGVRHHLVPLGDDRFAVGRYDDGRLEAVAPDVRIRFLRDELAQPAAIEVERDDSVWVRPRLPS